MSVTVWFRGPMLTIANKGNVTQILIPDARRDVAGPGEPGNPLKRHEAGMLATTSTCDFSIVLKNQISIHIADDLSNGKDCEADKSLDQLVPLDLLIPGLTAVSASDSNISGSVTLGGGTLSADMGLYVSKDTYTFPTQFGAGPPDRRVSVVSKWTSHAATATLTVNGMSMPLPDGANLYVFNFDVWVTSPNDFFDMASSCVGKGDRPDYDFKWAYWACNPPAGETWQTLRAKGELPIPVRRCAATSGGKSEPITKGMESPRDGDCLQGTIGIP